MEKNEPMTLEEFLKKAKELGYSKEDIQEQVDLYNESKEKGIVFPFEPFFVFPPYLGY